MDFSDTVTKQGLVQDCDWWANSDATSYPIADKVRSANMGLNEVCGIILEADGRWQWDDTNYTDLPIGTTTITASQQDYGIDLSMIDITRVEIKDTNGNWSFLVPMDQKDLNPTSYAPLSTGTVGTGFGIAGQNYSLTDFLKTPGKPSYYDKINNSLFLYPPPSYTQAASLKVYFQRKPSYFVAADTTKRPGFATQLHRYISIYMANDYAIAKMLSGNKINSLMAKMAEMKIAISNFYAERKKDEKPVLIARNTPSY